MYFYATDARLLMKQLNNMISETGLDRSLSKLIDLQSIGCIFKWSDRLSTGEPSERAIILCRARIVRAFPGVRILGKFLCQPFLFITFEVSRTVCKFDMLIAQYDLRHWIAITQFFQCFECSFIRSKSISRIIPIFYTGKKVRRFDFDLAAFEHFIDRRIGKHLIEHERTRQ